MTKKWRTSRPVRLSEIVQTKEPAELLSHGFLHPLPPQARLHPLTQGRLVKHGILYVFRFGMSRFFIQYPFPLYFKKAGLFGKSSVLFPLKRSSLFLKYTLKTFGIFYLIVIIKWTKRTKSGKKQSQLLESVGATFV
jgi:hypothetical protein